MDLLQIALVFFICLLTLFLALTGIQVFFILKELKRGLDQFNRILDSGGEIMETAQRPIMEIAQKSKAITKAKFYRKVLK